MTILGWLPSMFAQQSRMQEKNATKALHKEKHENRGMVGLYARNCPNCKATSWEYNKESAIAICLYCQNDYSVEFLTLLKS